MPVISGNTSGAFGTFCVFFIATDTTGHISTRHVRAITGGAIIAALITTTIAATM